MATHDEVVQSFLRYWPTHRKGSRLYWEPATDNVRVLYSYGRHYPAAAIHTVVSSSRNMHINEERLLVNSIPSSMSTERHKRLLPGTGMGVIYVPHVNPQTQRDHNENWDEYIQQVQTLLGEWGATTLRSEARSPYALEPIRAQSRRYLELFPDKIPPARKAALTRLLRNTHAVAVDTVAAHEGMTLLKIYRPDAYKRLMRKTTGRTLVERYQWAQENMATELAAAQAAHRLSGGQ